MRTGHAYTYPSSQLSCPSLSVSLSLPVSLTFSVSLSLSVSDLCLSLVYFSLGLSLSLFLDMCVFPSLSHSTPLCLSICLSIFLSLSLSISVPLSVSGYLSVSKDRSLVPSSQKQQLETTIWALGLLIFTGLSLQLLFPWTQLGKYIFFRKRKTHEFILIFPIKVKDYRVFTL